MIPDQKRRDKADAPKLPPYKDDPEALETFIRQLENVSVLESPKYKKDITKIHYAANLLQKNGADRQRDPVKLYEDYDPKIDLVAGRCGRAATPSVSLRLVLAIVPHRKYRRLCCASER